MLWIPVSHPSLRHACRHPMHHVTRGIRLENRAHIRRGQVRRKMEDRIEPKYKTLEASAGNKGLPVQHFATDDFTPPDKLEDMKQKHAPFFKPVEHRWCVPYYKDRSIEAAQLNKAIYKTLPPNKSAEIWPGVREEMRARRLLPVPISMTGLGLDSSVTSARYWSNRIRNMIEKLESEVSEGKSDKLIDNVTPGVKLMLESDGKDLSRDHKELQQFYNQAKNMPMSEEEKRPLVFPHALTTKIKQTIDQEIMLKHQEDKDLIDQEYDQYMKHRKVLNFLTEGLKSASSVQKMEADEADSEIEAWRDNFWRRSYGTPDPSVPQSNIPCGGCGALMHCIDPGIPGYLPSEKFTALTRKDKKKEVCQRCEFLDHFNVSIDVNVPPDEYPSIISKIKECKGIVVLMVDLLDFPCSIWPDALSLFGRRKIYVVGNKVDLLPQDAPDHLDRIRECLKQCLPHAGVDHAVHKHAQGVFLISAKTGFGVESLITRIYERWDGQEDIYLIGCTNVGKSTLFNSLLQSDLCAVRENDLIQRATTSVWPGTTLNLLKFPINKMQGWVKHKRELRMRYMDRVKAHEYELRRTLYRQTGHHVMPQIVDRIGTTFHRNIPFSIESGHPFAKRSYLPIPFEERAEAYKDARYFYDTPGTVYKDQLLSLLTTEELLKTVPREIITPRTFSLQPYQTLFVAGLGRMDLIHSRQNVLLTVFASKYLPIHVVYTQEAGRFYNLYLGSELMAVPCGDAERLKYLPPLVPQEIDLRGINWKESCADVVLSSAGWVSVTLGREEECVIKAYTPNGRGIFVRRPAMLPFAVNMRGRRIVNTPCFDTKVLTIQDMHIERDHLARRVNEYWDERDVKNSYKSFQMRNYSDDYERDEMGLHEVDPRTLGEEFK